MITVIVEFVHVRFSDGYIIVYADGYSIVHVRFSDGVQLPVDGLSAPISAFSKRLTPSSFVDTTITDLSS